VGARNGSGSGHQALCVVRGGRGAHPRLGRVRWSRPRRGRGPGAESGAGGQAGSGAQTGSTTTLVAQSPEEVAEEDEDNTGTIVALVISGLGAVALILALLTYRYWRNTRPAPRT
jgi:hypothetical protein